MFEFMRTIFYYDQKNMIKLHRKKISGNYRWIQIAHIVKFWWPEQAVKLRNTLLEYILFLSGCATHYRHSINVC